MPFFNNTKVYSWYVYHNDKHNRPNGTRDEYRLYLNKELDIDEPNNKRLYNPDDIVVFERVYQADNSIMPIYYMYRFEPNSENYTELDAIIDASISKGEHATYDGNLSFINSAVNNLDDAAVEISDDAKKELQKQQEEILSAVIETPKNTEDKIEDTKGAHLFNSVSFRDFVLLAYNYKCAITRESIVWKQLNNLEAAHIQPKAQAGTFLPCNGIALCRDMHWAFDKGFITITDDLLVEVHPEVKNTLLMQYQGRKLVIPNEQFFRPELKFS